MKIWIMMSAILIVVNQAFAQQASECDYLKHNSFLAYSHSSLLSDFAKKNDEVFNKAALAVDARVQATCKQGFSFGDNNLGDFLEQSVAWGDGCLELKKKSDQQICNKLLSEYIKTHRAYRAGLKDGVSINKDCGGHISSAGRNIEKDVSDTSEKKSSTETSSATKQ